MNRGNQTKNGVIVSMEYYRKSKGAECTNKIYESTLVKNVKHLHFSWLSIIFLHLHYFDDRRKKDIKRNGEKGHPKYITLLSGFCAVQCGRIHQNFATDLERRKPWIYLQVFQPDALRDSFACL